MIPKTVFNKKMESNYVKAQKLLKKTLEKVEASAETRKFIQDLFVKDYMPDNDEITCMIEQKLKEIVSSNFVLEAVTKKLFKKAIEDNALSWTEELKASVIAKVKAQMHLAVDKFDPDTDPDGY